MNTVTLEFIYNKETGDSKRIYVDYNNFLYVNHIRIAQFESFAAAKHYYESEFKL
jgi:hypothetical protein